MFPGITSVSAQTGGFVESATSTTARSPLSASQISALLPARGRFTFPSPYGTTATRLTNATDCAGSDCVTPVGYAYWSNINNHVGSDTMLIFLGLSRSRGGAGPTLFTYNKSTGETRNAGPLFDAASPLSWATGEGWYFSRTRTSTLYINDGPRMLRYDVLARSFETVFDIRQHLGSDRVIWQMHSSADDRVHSATIKHSSTYEALGCAVFREDTAQLTFVAKIGDYDECQIDKSGRWLVIKENVDRAYGEDNRIVDLHTGAEQVFYDQQGAAGHSDLGYGYMVAEDNYHNLPGAVRVWQLGESITASGQGRLVYHLTSWNVGGVGHLAHGNAKSGSTSVSDQVVCSSSAHRLVEPRVNEIVCYRLDGSLNVLVVAPNMTNLDASGGGGDYEKRPKGNLDVTGQYFVWTSNAGTGRLDAFIVHVPQAMLDATPPSGGGGTSTTGQVTWASLLNLTPLNGGLQKTSGCDGCPDATAVSNEAISGNGLLQWTAPEAQTLRGVGLAPGTTAAGLAEMPFAIRLQAGIAEVRELGTYKADVPFSTGDVFRIAVENGVVRYLKNGSVFYTSGSTASTALRVHVVVYNLNGAVSSVSTETSATAPSGGTGDGATSPTAPAPTPAPVIVTLTATGYKARGGLQKADLSWSGATTSAVDIYRNGTKITATANDGTHTDNIDKKGSGSYTYKVCESGANTCSNEATVSFR